MRVVFVGASKFGYRALGLAAGMDCCEIVGVVTNEKQFSISYNREGVTNVLHQDFEYANRDFGIPVYTMQKRMTEPPLLEQLKKWRPDLLLVVGWYHMVPRRIRNDIPAYGLHASLLPDYCGGAPLVWAMINGERETGITLFEMADGVDDGPVAGQAKVTIAPRDSIGSLYARVEIAGLRLIEEFLPKLANGTAALVSQENQVRRIYPQRSPDDGQIDWQNKSAIEVFDWVRAQTKPYPGAFGFLAETRISIWWVEVVEPTAPLAPGEVKITDSHPIVGCRDGTAIQIVDSTPSDREWQMLSSCGHLQFHFKQIG